MKYNNKKSLITKILLSFGIMATVIIAVVFISFINFKRLFASVEYLSQPDQKETVLNHMYKDVAASLKNIRLYALTGNRAYYDHYVEKTSEVRSLINLLKKKDHAHIYKEQIDSLENLLNLKDKSAHHLGKLIAKRKSIYSSLDNIKLQSDTVYYPSMAVETTQVNYMKAIPVKQEKENQKPLKRKSFLRRLFSFKQKEPDNSSNGKTPKVKYVPRSYFKIDTSIQVKAVPYSNIKEVRTQLARWGWRNKQIDEIITKEEEDLLHTNDSFSKIIQEIIAELREKEKRDQASNIQKAHLVVKKSTFVILVIGISGLAGCMLFLILIGKDIRLSNIYRSKLSQERRNAIRTARVKEQFLSNMSHEIRTPLGAIVGFSEQLDKATLSPDQKKYVSAIKNSSDHLLSLVNDILDLSKIEAGKMPVEKVNFKLTELAYDVYQNLKIKSDEKNLEFSYSIDPGLESTLRGDSLRLKQILFNLIGNAIKFTGEGSVKISFQKLNDNLDTSIVQIQVTDTGVGIPLHKHGNIFNEFEQSYDSDSRNFGGTGLGLAICKKLVTNMGGSIFFESEVNSGTTFTVLLPFDNVKAEEDKELHNLKNNASINLKGKRVLVVEDDPYITLLMKIIFVKHQILATFAEDGKEGIRKFKEGSFDLIIADMQLPELSGIDMVRIMRSEKDVPVILCSANVLENKKYKDLYSIRFLVKPFKEQELIDCITNALSTESTSTAPHISIPSAKLAKLYCLSGLQEIIRNEPDMRQLVNKIVGNGRSSVTDLQIAVDSNDERRIRKIAHKLIPSFSQLQAEALVKQLEKINRNQGDIIQEGEILIPLLISVLDELEKDLANNNLFDKKNSLISTSELN